MKTVHVVEKSVYLSFMSRMSESHYIDLDATHVLVLCDFSTTNDEDYWAQLPTVAPLPHPLSGKTVSAHPHLDKLSKSLNAAATDYTYDVMEKARKIHSMMRF